VLPNYNERVHTNVYLTINIFYMEAFKGRYEIKFLSIEVEGRIR
jgi:hypothetical protein